MKKVFNSRLYWFICIPVLIWMSGCGDGSEDGGKTILNPVYLLPDNNDISGWETIGAYEEANDYDSLYDLIDGGAEVFIDNGFVSAAFQIYQNCAGGACSDVQIHVRIYDQGSEANAKATYNKVFTGIGVSWNETGQEARIDESGLASYSVEFWKRNMYVQVVIEEKSDEALNIAKLFASHISSQIR